MKNSRFHVLKLYCFLWVYNSNKFIPHTFAFSKNTFTRSLSRKKLYKRKPVYDKLKSLIYLSFCYVKNREKSVKTTK